MGFADVTDNIRQLAGSGTSLRIEAGCFSANSTTATIPTRLSHVVGGMIVGCVTDKQVCGVPVIGSTNAAGTVDFTMSDAHDGCSAYIVAGW